MMDGHRELILWMENQVSDATAFSTVKARPDGYFFSIQTLDFSRNSAHFLETPPTFTPSDCFTSKSRDFFKNEHVLYFLAKSQTFSDFHIN